MEMTGIFVQENKICHKDLVKTIALPSETRGLKSRSR